MGLRNSMEMNSIDYVHAEVHKGKAFVASWYTQLAATGSVWIGIKTAGKENHTHFAVNAAGPVIVSIEESPTLATSTGGSLSLYNMNRTFSDNSVSWVGTGAVGTGGTVLYSTFIVGSTGGGVGAAASDAIGGSLRSSTEFIMKKNAWYLVSISNTAQVLNWIDFVLNFYEEN